MLKEIHAFSDLYSGLYCEWNYVFPYHVMFRQSVLLWSLVSSYFSHIGKLEKPLCSPQFCKCLKLAQATVASCGCSLACSCARVCAGTQELVWRLVWFWWTLRNFHFVLASVMSLILFSDSTAQTLVPAQEQREVQVALFSGGLSLTGLRFLCLSPCPSKVYANRRFPECKRVWGLSTNSCFPLFCNSENLIMSLFVIEKQNRRVKHQNGSLGTIHGLGLWILDWIQASTM